MKLQKLFIIATMLLPALAASAQFNTSIYAGATATTFGDQNIKLGLRAGASAEYFISTHWGIRSGLFYTMKGATTSKDVFSYNPKESTKLSYLDVPVEALFSFKLSNKNRLSLHAGPYLAYLIHSSLPTAADYTVRRWELGAGFGIDLSFGHFIITPEVQYGLTKVTKPGTNHNISYAISLGYRF